MGGDGQSVINKRSILENSKIFVLAQQEKNDFKDKQGDEQLKKERVRQQWTHCSISYEPLELPVAFDLRGRLYSKKTVIEEILARKEFSISQEKSPEQLVPILKLGDVCEIQNAIKKEKVEIRCPVTGFEASSGLHKFVGFWGCGHVLCCFNNTSFKHKEKSLETTTQCPYCGEPGFAVPLVCESKSDEEKQVKNLRPLLRAFRKRKRADE